MLLRQALETSTCHLLALAGHLGLSLGLAMGDMACVVLEWLFEMEGCFVEGRVRKLRTSVQLQKWNGGSVVLEYSDSRLIETQLKSSI